MRNRNVKQSNVSRTINKRPRMKKYAKWRKCRDIHISSKQNIYECSNCVTFRKQAENVNNYLSKGSLAGVDGRLQSRSYENKVGQRVFVTEVVADSVQFLEPKNNNQQPNNNYHQQRQTQTGNNPFDNTTAITDDDLPF
ncbi:Single-stranded DNA-binding protein ssb [Staphylococcus aureus]|nr:Single-stranded DNA-binding protein ssb [Staphylococcus aureus]